MNESIATAMRSAWLDANYPDEWMIPVSRHRWYNPMLDPYVIANKMSDTMAAAAERYQEGGDLHEPDMAHPFNLVSSYCYDGKHRPCFDVDHGDFSFDGTKIVGPLGEVDFGDSSFVVAASSTADHFHVYIPRVAYWPHEWMGAKLDELMNAGIIAGAYASASRHRGQTLLRPPHVRKITSQIDPMAVWS